MLIDIIYASVHILFAKAWKNIASEKALHPGSNIKKCMLNIEPGNDLQDDSTRPSTEPSWVLLYVYRHDTYTFNWSQWTMLYVYKQNTRIN